jgi:hypothetical protein
MFIGLKITARDPFCLITGNTSNWFLVDPGRSILKERMTNVNKISETTKKISQKRNQKTT